MRRFLLAATLFALIGMTSALADDPRSRVTQPVQPKQIPQDLPSTRITTSTSLEEELELLQAQRETRKGYLKAAEMTLKTSQVKLDELKEITPAFTDNPGESIKRLKLELEAAKGLFEARAGELKEVEVKIKFAKKRVEEAKAVAIQTAKGKVLEAGGAVMGMAGFGGIQLMAGLSEIQPQNANTFSRSKSAVFNMAMVMKHYGKAKYRVYELTEKRKSLSVDLIKLRGDFLKLQTDLKKQQNPATKEEMEAQSHDLAREIEDKDREINKQLNDEAAVIISQLYDEIKDVVDEMAKAKGYTIVFAYPDATSIDDSKNSYVKELKLKPPAAQPFYVAKQDDLTDEVIEKLNARNPAPEVPQAQNQPSPFFQKPMLIQPIPGAQKP